MHPIDPRLLHDVIYSDNQDLDIMKLFDQLLLPLLIIIDAFSFISLKSGVTSQSAS